jgi:hypothetical protein
MHLLHRKPFSLAISELPETAESYWRDCDFSIEAARIRQEKIGPHTAIHFAWKGAQFHISGKQFSIMIDMAKLPPFTQQLLLKIILNACSTTIFAATRCHGNWMTNLAPTNLKLIQRMERIMQLLALEEETPPPLLSIRQKLIHAVMDQKA